MLQRSAISRTEPAASTPSSFRRASGAGSRSKPSTSSLAFRPRLRHMASPITPSPMKPIMPPP